MIIVNFVEQNFPTMKEIFIMVTRLWILIIGFAKIVSTTSKPSSNGRLIVNSSCTSHPVPATFLVQTQRRTRRLCISNFSCRRDATKQVCHQTTENNKGENGYPTLTFQFSVFTFQFPHYSSVKRLSPNRPLSENTCTMKVPRISLNFF